MITLQCYTDFDVNNGKRQLILIFFTSPFSSLYVYAVV